MRNPFCHFYSPLSSKYHLQSTPRSTSQWKCPSPHTVHSSPSLYASSMAGALLDVDVLMALCMDADVEVEEEVVLDFFSMDLNEVVLVEVVDFFCTVWMVFFLLTWRTSMASMLTPCCISSLVSTCSEVCCCCSCCSICCWWWSCRNTDTGFWFWRQLHARCCCNSLAVHLPSPSSCAGTSRWPRLCSRPRPGPALQPDGPAQPCGNQEGSSQLLWSSSDPTCSSPAAKKQSSNY